MLTSTPLLHTPSANMSWYVVVLLGIGGCEGNTKYHIVGRSFSLIRPLARIKGDSRYHTGVVVSLLRTGRRARILALFVLASPLTDRNDIQRVWFLYTLSTRVRLGVAAL